MSEEKQKPQIGRVLNYFTQINVAVVLLSDTLKVGEQISFEGSTTSFDQKVESMQVERQDIPEGGKGQAVGIKVTDRVRPGDRVFRIG